MVLFLSPYHCELNPIELVWSQAKGNILSDKFSFKLADVKALTPAAFQLVAPENWSDYVCHVVRVEEQMWTND